MAFWALIFSIWLIMQHLLDLIKRIINKGLMTNSEDHDFNQQLRRCKSPAIFAQMMAYRQRRIYILYFIKPSKGCCSNSRNVDITTGN